ncbi:MAG: PocR ligand-binding domain-containing protein [Spirochaetales bacterium]|nr:PocR ligand-binding domain-containing protein [Spirochaetales bacterium]
MSTISTTVLDDELLRIVRHISRVFGVRASVLDVNYNEIAPLEENPICRYCDIIQKDIGLLGRCRRNDRDQCMRAKVTGTVHSYHCHAGLTEAVYPLTVGEVCVGYIIVGQFRRTHGIPADILGRVTGDAERRLKEAHGALPLFDPDTMESVLELIRIVSRYVIDHRLVSTRRHVLAGRLIDYVREHYRDNPTLQDAARYVRRSPSTVTHTLKAVTGKSFKKLLLATKIERAQRDLIDSPDLTIAQIAAGVGVSDPLYFSRLFRKLVGVPPSQFRSREPARIEASSTSPLTAPPA